MSLPRHIFGPRGLLVLIALLALVAPPRSAHAASGSWGVTTGGLWSDSGNWTGGTIADGQDSTATFNQTLSGTVTVNLDSPRTLGNLSFTSGSNQLWLIDDAGNPANVLTLSRSDATAPTITVATSSRAEIATVIDGTGGLGKTGTGNTGILILSGANTYSGTTTVSGGILRVANNDALGTSSVSVSNSGGIHLTDGITVTGRSITVASGGSNSDGGLAASRGGSATWTGPVVMEVGGRLGAVNDDTHATLEISGAVSGTNLIISAYGNGGVLLSAASGQNTYASSTQILRGRLILGAENTLPTSTILDVHFNTAVNASQEAILDLNGFSQEVARLQNSGNLYGQATVTNTSATAGTLTVNQAANTTYSGQITGAMSLVKSGTGNLTLAPTLIVNPGSSATQENTSNTFTGTTRVDAGTLTLSAHSGTYSRALAASTYDTDSAGTLSFGTMTRATFGGLSGTGTLPLQNASSGAVTLELGGFNSSGSFGGTLTGAGGLTKVGTGTLTLSGTNSYSGNTAVNAGTLAITTIDALPGYTSAGQVSVDATATLMVPNAVDDTAVDAILSNGTFATDGRIGFDTSAGDRTYATAITGSKGLVKAGGNTLTISGSNTLATIRVMGGTLQATAADAWGGSGGLILNDGTFEYAPPAGTSANIGGRTITLEGNGSLRANTPSETTQFQVGTIVGTGQLTLLGGTGLFTRGGGSTYTGGTIVKPGARIAVTGSSTGSAGAPTGGPFGTGTLRLEGGGLRSSTGANQTIGNATTLAGDVEFISAGANQDRDLIFSGPVTIEGATRTLTVNSRVNTGAGATGIFFNGVVSDGGNDHGLTKAGPGTLVLGGANTYGGATTVSAGTLKLAVAGAVGGSSDLTIASGASLDVSAISGGFTLGSGQSLGGAGSILGDLVFGSGSKLVFSTTDTLAMAGGTASFFSGTPGSRFGIDDLVGISSSTPTGTYTLISGTVDTTHLDNLGSTNAFDLGDGVSAYFLQGSLQVIVVPEPESLAAVAVGLAAIAAAFRLGRTAKKA